MAFTSRDEIERLFSADAVSLRIDDAADSGAEDDIMEEIISDATEMVWQYLWERYDEADASDSEWVRRRTTWIAAYLLSCRKGNPSQYIDRYQNIIEELNAVHSRVMHVPRLNVLVPNQPTLSNYEINNNGPAPVVRVNPWLSVETWPGQRTTVSNPYPDVI